MTQLRSSRSRNTRREFCSLHVWIRTWRALHCQSLKHKLKKCDLRLRLKERKLSAWWTASGKLFHTTGPPQRKPCCKFPPRIRGTVTHSIIRHHQMSRWFVCLYLCLCVSCRCIILLVSLFVCLPVCLRVPLSLFLSSALCCYAGVCP